MKKSIYGLVLVSFLLFGCNDVSEEVQMLQKEKVVLEQQIARLQLMKDIQVKETTELAENLKGLKICNNEERSPQYILKIQLKQSHFTLDLGKHMKDAMNAIEFEIPVSKDYYNSLNVGDDIVDEFRVGSMVLYGSFGDWEMSVLEKRLEGKIIDKQKYYKGRLVKTVFIVFSLAISQKYVQGLKDYF